MLLPHLVILPSNVVSGNQRAKKHNVTPRPVGQYSIKTRFSQVLWQTPQIADPVLKGLALGCFGEPEDVAGLALYLASSALDYVTGAVFVVDGGMNVATSM